MNTTTYIYFVSYWHSTVQMPHGQFEAGCGRMELIAGEPITQVEHLTTLERFIHDRLVEQHRVPSTSVFTVVILNYILLRQEPA